MTEDDEIKQPPPGDDEDWNAALEKFRGHTDTSKKGRKKRQQALDKAVDGRSLRASGRDQHLNFKASPAIKAALHKHVPRGKISLWLEEAILAKLKAEGYEG